MQIKPQHEAKGLATLPTKSTDGRTLGESGTYKKNAKGLLNSLLRLFLFGASTGGGKRENDQGMNTDAEQELMLSQTLFFLLSQSRDYTLSLFC